MIALLGFLLDGIELIGTYVLWAIESGANVIFAAMGAAVAALFALLPSMSDALAIGTPTWLGWLNWFYPVGALLDGLAALISLWLGYLAVRWALRLLRAL